MKTQADLPPIREVEDYLLRVPALSGYKPRGCGVISLVDDRIQFSATMGDDRIMELPVYAAAVQRQFNPSDDKALVVTYFAPKAEDATITTLLAEALCLTSATHIPYVDLAYVVDWEENSWVGSSCGSGTPHHEFGHDIVRPPGQTIFEDLTGWVEQFEPKWVELSPEEDQEVQTIEAYLARGDREAREYLVAAATDPRGMDLAQIVAIEKYIVSGNVLDVAKTWLANGWNVDNLVQLSAHVRSPYAGNAVGMTLLGDGFLPYAGVVAKLTVPTPDTYAIRDTLLDQDDQRVQFLMELLNRDKERYVLV